MNEIQENLDHEKESVDSDKNHEQHLKKRIKPDQKNFLSNNKDFMKLVDNYLFTELANKNLLNYKELKSLNQEYFTHMRVFLSYCKKMENFKKSCKRYEKKYKYLIFLDLQKLKKRRVIFVEKQSCQNCLEDSHLRKILK